MWTRILYNLDPMKDVAIITKGRKLTCKNETEAESKDLKKNLIIQTGKSH